MRRLKIKHMHPRTERGRREMPNAATHLPKPRQFAETLLAGGGMQPIRTKPQTVGIDRKCNRPRYSPLLCQIHLASGGVNLTVSKVTSPILFSLTPVDFHRLALVVGADLRCAGL